MDKPAMNFTRLLLLCLSLCGAAISARSADASTEDSIFNTEKILDESTLETKTLQDWHTDKATGSTRQKLIEIKVAEWLPGKDYRIPVRLIVPLKGKAKGFHITGANAAAGLMKDIKPNVFDAKLLGNGVGIVKTVVKPLAQIPGKQGLEQKMGQLFLKDLNPRYTNIWIWSMTLMRATTAAYAETGHFEKGKVAGSGGSKNGISPATALINDERFTATFSKVAFAWASPTRKVDREKLKQAKAASQAFFEAAQAGEFKQWAEQRETEQVEGALAAIQKVYEFNWPHNLAGHLFGQLWGWLQVELKKPGIPRPLNVREQIESLEKHAKERGQRVKKWHFMGPCVTAVFEEVSEEDAAVRQSQEKEAKQ